MNLGKTVKRITILTSDPSGQSFPTVVYKKKRKHKKGSPGLRNLDKMTRDLAKAQNTQSDFYLRKHKRSNAKKKNGWLRDLGENMARASSKGRKKIHPRRWF